MARVILGTLLAALVTSVLPARASERYRFEIGGEPVGFATMAISCAEERCRTVWESAARAPEATGGEVFRRRITVVSDAEGREAEVAIEVRDGHGKRRPSTAPAAVPATLAELLLSEAVDGERRCLSVADEESGLTGQACARRRGDWLEGNVLGVPLRFRARRGRPPLEVLLPSQGARFVADARAALPAAPPRLFGVRVPESKAGIALRFCGVRADPPPAAPPIGMPPPRAGGASCREETTRYLEAARAAGFAGRRAVGVAFDGTGFVWHEWSELRDGDGWVPVDPSFEQLPAAGPRFTLARFADEDEPARAEAGRRVLECWGKAHVE